MNEIRFNLGSKISQNTSRIDKSEKDREKVFDEVDFKRKPFKGFRIFIFIFSVLVILFGLVFLSISSYKMFFSGNSYRSDIYTAFFLTNGQIYFGKISYKNKNEVMLKDAYYIQNTDNLTESASSTEKGRFEIVKSGSEIYGPNGDVYLNMENVSSYEYLREDSKVVQKINSIKN